MRFCQTDGTPLVADVPDDPYKTMVAGKDEIAAAIPPAPQDPFKTMVAGSQSKEEEDDLLQIPEDGGLDPMKTVANPQSNFVQDAELSKKEQDPVNEINLQPIKESAPPSPFDSAPPKAEDKADVFSSPPPAPPKFNEPEVAPPNLSDLSSPAPPLSNFSFDKQDDLGSPESTTNDQTVIYPSSPLPPLSKESSEPPPTMLGDSPFDKPKNSPIPSPFGDAPKESYEQPSSPLPSNPPFKEPEASPFGDQSNPFNQPSFNQGENINQNMQQQDWNPPPAPDSGWQNQNVGQNTPFQPPAAGGGQNQTLPIISLVLGIISICCYISPLTGIAALITGFLGMKNANNNPNQYGGKGLAIAGMITGGVFLLLGLLYWVLIFLGVAMGSFSRF